MLGQWYVRKDYQTASAAWAKSSSTSSWHRQATRFPFAKRFGVDLLTALGIEKHQGCSPGHPVAVKLGQGGRRASANHRSKLLMRRGKGIVGQSGPAHAAHHVEPHNDRHTRAVSPRGGTEKRSNAVRRTTVLHVLHGTGTPNTGKGEPFAIGTQSRQSQKKPSGANVHLSTSRPMHTSRTLSEWIQCISMKAFAAMTVAKRHC